MAFLYTIAMRKFQMPGCDFRARGSLRYSLSPAAEESLNLASRHYAYIISWVYWGRRALTTETSVFAYFAAVGLSLRQSGHTYHCFFMIFLIARYRWFLMHFMYFLAALRAITPLRFLLQEYTLHWAATCRHLRRERYFITFADAIPDSSLYDFDLLNFTFIRIAEDRVPIAAAQASYISLWWWQLALLRHARWWYLSAWHRKRRRVQPAARLLAFKPSASCAVLPCAFGTDFSSLHSLSHIDIDEKVSGTQSPAIVLCLWVTISLFNIDD